MGHHGAVQSLSMTLLTELNGLRKRLSVGCSVSWFVQFSHVQLFTKLITSLLRVPIRQHSHAHVHGLLPPASTS